MPLSQWNLEFLNHNSQRSFPLTDDATKSNSTGTFTIPDDFIVGLDIPVSTAMDMQSGRFFIRQLGLFASGIQVIIAYDDGAGTTVDVATALIPDPQATRNSVFALGGIAPFDDTMGKIVVGRLDTIKDQPTGLFTFTIDETRISPLAVRPMIRGITGISVADGFGTESERLFGDIELVAGNNIQLQTVNTATATKVIINAINGEGTIDECVCEGDAAEIPCIKTINGVSPTAEGKFFFVGDDCLTFADIDNGQRVTDSCCAPCCGCEELESITRDLERLNANRSELELFINEIASTATIFHSTVLGSRLGDRKCLTCE